MNPWNGLGRQKSVEYSEQTNLLAWVRLKNNTIDMPENLTIAGRVRWILSVVGPMRGNSLVRYTDVRSITHLDLLIHEDIKRGRIYKCRGWYYWNHRDRSAVA